MQRRSAGFCSEPSANSRGIGYQLECAPTLRGVVPKVLVINEKDPVDDFGRPGGANIAWNENEISPTLRREEHGHQPIVVLKDDDIGRGHSALQRSCKEEP